MFCILHAKEDSLNMEEKVTAKKSAMGLALEKMHWKKRRISPIVNSSSQDFTNVKIQSESNDIMETIGKIHLLPPSLIPILHLYL